MAWVAWEKTFPLLWMVWMASKAISVWVLLFWSWKKRGDRFRSLRINQLRKVELMENIQVSFCRTLAKRKTRRSAVNRTIKITHSARVKVDSWESKSMKERIPHSRAPSAALEAMASGRNRKMPFKRDFLSHFFNIFVENVKKLAPHPLQRNKVSYIWPYLMPLSSSGPGLGIFIPATAVRNRLGV